jgi:hypothetical protein
LTRPSARMDRVLVHLAHEKEFTKARNRLSAERW